MPAMPHSAAGPRMLPPVSEPSAPIHSPAATAAPEPLLLPPGICAVFQGLRAGGNKLVKSGPPSANSCIASFPSRMAPAASSLATVVASSSGTRSGVTRDIAVVLMPAVSYKSFSPMGMPCIGPRYRPAAISASACRAWERARSAVSVT